MSVSVPARRPLRLPRDFTLAFTGCIGAIAVLVGVAFYGSYSRLVPLADSDSPETVLLLVPFAGLVLLARNLAEGGRDGGELGVNVVFAVPLLFTLAGLLVVLPAKLSYFYTVYRFDLLAVPVFVAAVVVLLFGVPALWRARLPLLVLVLGWPPIADWIIGLTSHRLATAMAGAAGAISSLLGLAVERQGDVFLFGAGGERDGIIISSACSGLVGVFSIAVVGGIVFALADGPIRAKQRWMAVALAGVLLVNLVRIVALLAVASTSGVEKAMGVFHMTAGILLFALLVLAMLLSLPWFGLRLEAPSWDSGVKLEFTRRSLLTLVAFLLAVTVLVRWSPGATATGEPGLYRGAATVQKGNLLPLPPGWQQDDASPAPALARLFGGGTVSSIQNLTGPRGQHVGAQVIVTPSYWDARRYGVLQCFVYHDYKVFSLHSGALPGGGSTALIAARFDKDDVATASWIQPVLLDGDRAWRRVLLYQYPSGARPDVGNRSSSAPSAARGALDALSPYGGAKAPKRFADAERDLSVLASTLVVPRSTASR